MTLDAGKITNTAFILHDVLSDNEKKVLLKMLINMIKCLRLPYLSSTFLFTFESIDI